jgi:hypothetical protein
VSLVIDQYIFWLDVPVDYAKFVEMIQGEELARVKDEKKNMRAREAPDYIRFGRYKTARG